MATVTIAAVQAAYILMDQRACLEKAITLLQQASDGGAGIVVFPEAFIPGTPIWIDSRPIWDSDANWYAMLVDQAGVVPGAVTGHSESPPAPHRRRPGVGARCPSVLRLGWP